MNEQTAATVSKRLLRVYHELNDVLLLIQESCTEEEFREFRREFGTAMGAVALSILDRIFVEHPHLEPPELRKHKNHPAD